MKNKFFWQSPWRYWVLVFTLLFGVIIGQDLASTQPQNIQENCTPFPFNDSAENFTFEPAHCELIDADGISFLIPDDICIQMVYGIANAVK